MADAAVSDGADGAGIVAVVWVWVDCFGDGARWGGVPHPAIPSLSTAVSRPPEPLNLEKLLRAKAIMDAHTIPEERAAFARRGDVGGPEGP